MTEENGRGRTLKTTQTSFEIIEKLQELGEAQISELAKSLELNVSTAHHHVLTLKEMGYVIQKDGSYRLSWEFLTLAGQMRAGREYYKKIMAATNELAYETGERVQFILEENGKGVWIATSLGPDAILTDIRMGLREPLHTIAAGKAILAHLPESRVHDIVDNHGLTERTDNTITTEEELFAELDGIRERGFAVNDQERIELEMGIGVPIRVSNSGQLLGAMSISAHSQRWNTDDLVEQHAELLLEAKTELELGIAYE